MNSLGIIPSEDDIIKMRRKEVQKKKIMVALAVLLTVSYGLSMASHGVSILSDIDTEYDIIHGRHDDEDDIIDRLGI